MGSDDVTRAARDENSRIRGDNRSAVLSWGLFWRMVFAQAAPLFLVAAVICFFAYNWAAMPVMAKFGLLILLILCSAGLALWRGLESTAGSLGLLACGLLAGPLLAVYEQAYQTGADPWELFRAWSLFLIPLALVGRRTGLWFVLWITATLWAGLYLGDLARFADRRGEDQILSNYAFYLAAGQAAALMLWETAFSRFAGPEHPFLRSRWLPRVMAFPLMTFLTCILAACLLFPREMRFGSLHLMLYLVLMGWGCYHYTQKKRDVLMVAYGLMSLLSLATTLPLMGIERFEGLSARFLLVVLVLAGGATGAVKALMSYHTASFSAVQPEDVAGRDTGVKELETDGEERRPEDTEPHSHPAHKADAAGFQATGPKDGLSLSSAYAPRLMRFALSGELPSGKKGTTAERAAGAPWPAKVLAGLCAWIAAPFIVALLGLLLASTMGTGGLIGLLVLAAAAGAFLSRLPGGGVFKDQAALCLTLAGTLGAGMLYAHDYSQNLPYLLLLALFAVGTFVVDNAIYRFFAAAIGIPVLTMTVLMPGLDGSSFYYFFKSVEDSLVSPVIPALFFSLLCVALAHVRTMPAASRPDSGGLANPRWSPSLAGCHAALFLMGVPSFGGFLLLFGGFFPLFDMIGVGAGVGLIYLAFRISRQLSLPVPQQAFFLILSAAVACISLRLPWFGAGLFALALSRRAGSTPLMGLAILGLAVGINLEYYSLNTSLLRKSVSLAAIGLLLTAAALVLHRLLLTAVRTGRLPDPLLLLAGESVMSPATDTSPDTAPDATSSPSPAGGRAIRQAIAAACLGLFLALFAWSVMQKERLLASGDQIILALRPVDPRSLMQGDYMVLRLAVEEDIRHSLYDLSDDDRALAKGVAVVEIEQGKPARFKRLDNGSSLANGEKRLVFRGREGEIQVSSGAFFFQEGHGKAYERARFALLRVDSSGNGLITALLDERMETIRPELEKEQPGGQ